MRIWSIGIGLLITGVIAPLAVGSPGQLLVLQSEMPDTVWAPPDDADDVSIPDLNLPQEPWTPAERDRFSEDPPASDRGIAPFGAPIGTVAAAPGTGELPWFAFHDFAFAPDAAARVNLANGNLLVTANDFAIAAPGYALRHDRFYNGLSTVRGSQGGGWHSNNGSYDIGIDVRSTYADFSGPNGLTLRFTRPSSAVAEFTAPDGVNMSLREDTSSGDFRYILTHNQSGDEMRFSVQGWISATFDRNGVGAYYAYSQGFIVGVYDDGGRALTFDWDMSQTHNLLAVEDSAGRQVEYTYSPATDALTTVKSVDGKITVYNYDSTGRLSSIELPGTAAATTTVTFAYDSSHRVTSVTQDAGIVTTFSYGSGETVVTDPNGNDATYSIDATGRVTSTEDALNRTRSQTWTANSDIATTTDALGVNTTTYTYDGSNNRTSAELPTGAAAAAVYAIGPDCLAPNTGTAYQPKCSTDDAGNTKEFEYDAAGNILRQTDTTGSTPVHEFVNTYSGCGGFAGQICTSKDGNGNTTSYTYDSHGNLTTVTPPAPLGTTSYSYDSLGRVTSVTDGNGDTTSYQYDVRDRIVLTTFEGGQHLITAYYDNGLERTRTDSAGGSIEFSYDHQGRLLEQDGPRAGVTQSYTYDSTGNLLTYTDPSGTVTYTYDAANQLLSVREPGGTCPSTGDPTANSGCVLFSYDDNGLETKRVSPGGATVETSRDNSGRPTRITAATGPGTTVTDIGYSYTASGDDRFNVQTRTSYIEQGITAGAATTYSYDSRNRLTLAEEQSGTSITASWSYTYDDAGNRTQQVRSGGTGQPAGTIDYGYNTANQLTSMTGQTTTWTYDSAGNQTRTGSTGTVATYGDRGEQASRGSTTNATFGVGNIDRLTSGVLTFNNGALGLMQRSEGSITQAFTRTASGDAVGYRNTSQSYYYIHDHLGSVVGVLSSTGGYLGGYSYSPYGEERSTSSTAGVQNNPLRYIGEHMDSDGTYKFGGRYYDPSQARFTQMDPSGQETNPYAYATCNPINSKDPTGLQSSVTVDCALAGSVRLTVDLVWRFLS